MSRKITSRKLGRRWWSNWRRLILLGVAIATTLLLILTEKKGFQASPFKGNHQKILPLFNLRPMIAQPIQNPKSKIQNRVTQLPWVETQGRSDAWETHDSRLPTHKSLVAATELSPSSLPVPQTHPLPPTLAQWQDASSSGDYFSEIKLTPVGYLVWCQFPIKVYVQRPTDSTESSSSTQRFQKWVDAVLQAVREWSVYLPLEVVAQPTTADISILRSRPPLQASLNRETGQFNIPRARSAETRYEFYLRKTVDAPEGGLSQRFTIQLSPDQTIDYTLATARHELGHALGIWGHSPLETDVMYFSQVRNSPQISARDINTLKRVYEQPTRLGWSLTSKSSGAE